MLAGMFHISKPVAPAIHEIPPKGVYLLKLIFLKVSRQLTETHSLDQLTKNSIALCSVCFFNGRRTWGKREALGSPPRKSLICLLVSSGGVSARARHQWTETEKDRSIAATGRQMEQLQRVAIGTDYLRNGIE